MEYVYYSLFIVVLIVFVKRVFFTKTRLKKTSIEPTIVLLNPREIIIEEEVKPKIIKPVVYQLNTDAIKLNLYSFSIFKSGYMLSLYKEIIIKKYYLDEPFHSSFVNIISHIGQHKYWIKSPKTKEIIMNVRGFDSENLQGKAMYVLDVRTLLKEMIIDIFKRTNSILGKSNTQILMLSSIVYIFSESGNIKDFYNDDLEKDELYNVIIETFFNEYSSEIKMKIIPTENINYDLIVKTYFENIENEYEYPNYVTKNENGSRNIKLIGNTQKKLTNEY